MKKWNRKLGTSKKEQGIATSRSPRERFSPRENEEINSRGYDKGMMLALRALLGKAGS